MAIVQPAPKSLRELLSNRKYKVPIFQRPYSWSLNEIEELWNDILDNESPYFLGIILLRETKEKENTFEVVDGQQRLATLVLLIKAASELIEDSHEKNKMLKYIYEEDLGKSEQQFILSLNLKDNDIFKTLLSDNKSYLPPTWMRKSPSWKSLETTKIYFKDKLNKLGEDNIIPFIRDKVLKLEMIDVHIQSDDDVYLFFETLNDRGMDLSIADLVKNRVCGLEAVDPYQAASRIDKITEDILVPGKIKPFLLHYCWALTNQDPPPPVKKLMDWYNRIIREEKADFLTKLEEYANYYSEFIDPKKSKSTSRNSLIYLKALGATRCYPLLLVARKNFEPKAFSRLCDGIEILTVRWSTIAQKDAKKLEKFYLSLAEKIREGSELDEIILLIKKQASEITDEVFVTNFKEFDTLNMQIARYLLLKIEDFQANSTSVGLDWDKLTLDHILPRRPSQEETSEYINRLGNMVLLSEVNNKKLGNKPYSAKKETYLSESRLKLPEYIVETYEDFTDDSIKEQQEYLSELAKKVWSPENIRY